MIRQEFEVTLKDNVIVSQTAATIGQHQSLDYIPGSVFLGVAAARLYAELEREDPAMAWKVFHSGAYRFGNATLTAGDFATVPLPMAFHTLKGENWKQDGSDGLKYLQRGKVMSFLAPAADVEQRLKAQQPVQIRAGFINARGAVVTADYHYEMKTAVSEHSNVAAENQLFGYQSLKSGQTFRFILESHEQDTELFARIAGVFDGQIRVGRSRSAQFGRALCRPLKKLERPGFKQATQFHVLCCADVALTTAGGVASYQPQASDLGLPDDWTFDLSRSFIRTRQYSPYNGKRRCYDPERLVIQKGSVLSFAGGCEASLPDTFAIGSYQEQGLGRVQLMSDWMLALDVDAPGPEQGGSLASAAVTQVSAPDTPLIHWLTQRLNQPGADDVWVTHMLERYRSLLDSARRLNGIASAIAVGPSKSQWGNLYQELRSLRHASVAQILKRLFDSTTGLCTPRGSDEYAWSLEVMDRDHEQPVPLSRWFESQLRAAALDEQQLIPTLILLAHRMMAIAGEHKEAVHV